MESGVELKKNTMLKETSESDTIITQEIEEGVRDSVKAYFRIGKEKLDNSDGGKFVQFQSMVKFLLGIVCCLLYVVQTHVTQHSHFSLPQHCCPILFSLGEPCNLNRYPNNTLGGLFEILGCDDVDTVSHHNRRYYNSTVNVNLNEKIPIKTCKNFCSNISNNTCHIENNICDCVIECGENLYCAAQKKYLHKDTPDNCAWRNENYQKLLFYERPLWLYIVQSITSIILMVNAVILAIIQWRRGTRLAKIFDTYLLIDCFNGTLFLVSFAYAPCLKDLYVPIFLQCFSASVMLKRALFSFDVSISENKYFTALVQTITGLAFRLLSVLFIFICIIQYLERMICLPDRTIITLFDGFWFAIVTITTVGYGDISPITYLGKISTIILILVIIVILPNILGEILDLITNSRTNYKFYHSANRNKHIVLVVAKLDITSLNDYLEEFYAQEENEKLTTVILTFQKNSSDVKVRLSSPALKKKVFVIQGSALLIRDLYRVKLLLAKACVVLSNRATDDQQANDHETILRATAIRAYAPNVKLYVHILRIENIINVKFANQIVCEGELKHLIIANNCLYPGLSSFLAIVTHTTQPKISSNHEWKQLYEYCSGYEIYDIKLKESLLFRAFEGKNFIFAAIVRLRSKGVLLFAVQPENEKHILLNPGRQYILKKEDTLFYIAQDQEIIKDVASKDENVKKDNKGGEESNSSLNSDIKTNKDESGIESAKERNHNIFATIMEDAADSELDMNEFNQIVVSPIYRSSRRCSLGGESILNSDHKRKLPKWRSSHTMDSTTLSTPISTNSQKQNYTFNLPRKPNNQNEKIPYDVESCTRREKQRTRPLLLRLATLDFGKEEKISPEVSKYCVKKIQNRIEISEANGIIELNNEDCEEINEITSPKIFNNDDKQTRLGVHPSPLYAGHDALCRLNRSPMNLCCLQAGWKMNCHEDKLGIHHIKSLCLPEEPPKFLYPEPFEKFLIVCTQVADVQLLQFILPMRTYNIEPEDIMPIIILVNEMPSVTFLQAISWFPSIRFIIGSMESVDDMVIAGAYEARGVVMFMTASYDDKEEVHMADASRLSCAEKMSKIFAHATFFVELTERWSMRLLKLQGGYVSSRKLPINNLYNYMRTTHFMSSQGFTSSMLDSLLYQSIQKPYIMDLVRLLLGEEQTAGSGYLAQVVIGEEVNSDDTYGKLIVKLGLKGDLPIAIYRKRAQKSDAWIEFKNEHDTRTIPFLERKIAALNRTTQVSILNNQMMQNHVLVNPPPTTPIISGDTILVIRICTETQYNTLELYKKSQYSSTKTSNIEGILDEDSQVTEPRQKNNIIDAIMKRKKNSTDSVNRFLFMNREFKDTDLTSHTSIPDLKTKSRKSFVCDDNNQHDNLFNAKNEDKKDQIQESMGELTKLKYKSKSKKKPISFPVRNLYSKKHKFRSKEFKRQKSEAGIFIPSATRYVRSPHPMLSAQRISVKSQLNKSGILNADTVEDY